MKITIKKRHNVEDGLYLAKVKKIEDYKTKSGAYSIRIMLVPFDNEGDFEPVYVFLAQECFDDAVGLQLYDALDIEMPKVVTTQKMQKAFVDQEVCVDIEVNDLGLNKVYRNVVAILPADEIDEFHGIDEKDSELPDGMDEEEIEEEIDDDAEEEEEEEELDDEDEADLEEEDDEDEEYLPWGGSKTQSTSRNNQRRGRR